MIIKEIKHLCPDCGSDQLKRNGFTTGGKQNMPLRPTPAAEFKNVSLTQKLWPR